MSAAAENMNDDIPPVEKHAERNMDALDASVFTGDTFEAPAAMARLMWYMGRWQREFARRLATIKETT